MTGVKGGGPAFPRPMSVSHGGVHEHQEVSGDQDGMTLRDYFAARAMQATVRTVGLDSRDHHQTAVARNAYKMADAMLAAREGEKP